MTQGALDGVRVLELPGVAGAYCGKLLAGLGAEVVKAEPAEGDPGRRLGPFMNTKGPSLWFLHFAAGKRSAVFDLSDRQASLELLRDVDVVIDTFTPGTLEELGLGYRALSRVNPGMVLTSITPFGQTGPYARFTGPDLVPAAMSGLLSGQGDPDRPPCNAPLEQGYQLAGAHAAMATVYALLARRLTGLGDHVDVSIQEVLGHLNVMLARYDLDSEIVGRPGDRGQQAGINVYKTADGWVHMYARRWERLTDWVDSPELNDPKWGQRRYREDHQDEANRIIGEFTGRLSAQEMMVEGQARGLAVAPVNDPEGLATSAHLAACGFFIDVAGLRMAGPPFRLSETPWRVSRPAPALGEHTREAIGAGTGPGSYGTQRGGGGQAPALRPPSRPAQARAPALHVARGPLAGVRVLDFTVAFAGPFATRYLAELGAEVIKVESTMAATNTEAESYRSQFPGGRNGQFMEINRSKRSITLDLHRPEAQALARRLAALSDIAIDNLRPGALARWGLGYDDLRKVNPGIIMAEMPGFGATGPNASFISLGATLMAYTGLTHLWGYPDSPPSRHCKMAYPDWIGAVHAALAILAALLHRERTGQGQYIEVAQVETTTTMVGLALLDYEVNGQVWQPAGNRHPTYAPHDVYPCRGDDRWVAVAVTNDEEWARLAGLLGLPGDWNGAARKVREGEIDARLSEWTRGFTPHQAMRLLQGEGVPAGAVQNGEDLWHDPHLRSRGYAAPVDQPHLGPVVQAGTTVQFRRARPPQPRGAPLMGEANEYVFEEVLGLSPGDLQGLHDAGIAI